jgi:diaminopropionate ammonia-lyase
MRPSDGTRPRGDVVSIAPICQPDRVTIVDNPRVRHDAAPGADLEAVLSPDGFARARALIERWPGYTPTPLVGLPGLARQLGVDRVWYKDEAGRFGLGSFKALGGAYAVAELILRKAAAEGIDAAPSIEALLAGRYRAVAAQVTVCCATDGNHGRSVAWGARLFGCRAVIYIHATVSGGRMRAIEAYGAEVRRVAGNYDDSVRQAAADATAEGWTVVSDTSYEGYTEIPKDVMQGYGVMAAEALEQLPAGERPSHVFVQGGVGGLAAAVCMQTWWRFAEARPRLVVVEPENAACLLASARSGHPAVIEGDLETVMAGLSCGEPSLLAWEVLDQGADVFMSVPDEAAIAMMRLLADGVGDDPPIVAGESAVAGLAGAIAAAENAGLRDRLRLDGASRVLVFGTEGATDPELYESIVGRPPESVGRGAAGETTAVGKNTP